MDNRCNLNMPCPAAGLTTASPDTYNNCKVPQVAVEDVDGCKCRMGTTFMVTKANNL